MPPKPSRLPTSLLIAFGLVNLPLSMLMSPTAAVLPNFYLDCSVITLAMALGMPPWLRLMQRVEKHRGWSIAAAGMMATPLAVLHPLDRRAHGVLARRLASRPESPA
jgi:hypothetical protein